MAKQSNNLPSIKDESADHQQVRLQPIEYDKQIKAKPLMSADYEINIAGCDGLLLRIRPSGKREFRHRYTHPIIRTKRTRLSIGDYPAVSLKRAKELYYDNLSLLADGIDPKEHREQ